MMYKLIHSVAGIAASVDATKSNDPVGQYRVVERVESKDADTVTILQSQPTKACCQLPDRSSTLVRSPVSLGVKSIDIHGLILVEQRRVEVPR